MYEFFKDLGILIITAEVFSLLARKIKAPQVVGQIAAGLIVGPCVLGLVETSDTISVFAEMGVILLMFSTGLDTNLKQLLKAGPIAFLVACMGVIVPLILGYLTYGLFYGFGAVGSDLFYKGLFMGTIITATSVSITVAALKELGKLSEFTATTIVSAAVIDDVIGIVLLTCVNGSGSGSDVGSVLVSTFLFFLMAIGVGFIIFYLMKKLDARYPRTHRLSILSVGFCFLMAYVAENYFGIADITGAYCAGVILCSINDSHYVESKVETTNYLFFAPLFFASIGLKTDISGFNSSVLLFSIVFIVVALLSKIAGCGLAAKICKFSNEDALKVGVGMMTRGEVALIVAQKGLAAGKVDSIFFTTVILLILVSSIITPVILGKLYKNA